MNKKGKKKNNVKWIYEPKTDSPFVNPYNFIKPSKSPSRKPSVKGTLTGYIQCRAIVKDKLIIPDVNENTDKDLPKYDFFSVNGRYIIPGSELRGCIRSVFETLTGSCFSVINTAVISSRVSKPDNSRKPGLLRRENSEWRIYPAKFFNEKKYDGRECDLICKWQKKGEVINPATRYCVFDDSTEEQPLTVTDDDITKLDEVFDMYRLNALDKLGKEKQNDKNINDFVQTVIQYRTQLEEMRKLESSNLMIAVYYGTDRKGNLVYLSPAHTGRKAYRNTIPKLLGEYDSCKNNSELCPACSLFGTIGTDRPLASKLRFSDALGENVTVSADYIILPELSSPKISSIEFYTHNSEKRDYDTKGIEQWDYDTKGTELRGRKFYFHGEPCEEKIQGKRQSAVKPVLKDSEFSFRIYFDNITKTELQKLLWVITLGDNSEKSNYLHKLGTGKPVGYGSVKLLADHIVYRQFDSETFAYSLQTKSYSEEMQNFETQNFKKKFFDESALEQFLKIAKYDLLLTETDGIINPKVPIAYPLADDQQNGKNSKTGHKWFSANRTGKKFTYTLPDISENPNDMILYFLLGRQEKELIINTEYEVEICGYRNKKGKDFFQTKIDGMSKDIPFYSFPEYISANPSKATREHIKVKMIYKGKHQKYEFDIFEMPK